MKMNKIRVSIIIPIYNLEMCIKNCLKSLMKQNYPFNKLEVILIDDGSTDESADICQEYAERFPNILFLHQEKKGVSAARNLGIKHATGKYIFFLDADDWLSENTIKECVVFFESVQNKVDLITYPMETLYQGRILKPHFRYQYLKRNGVYDLCPNAFIGQTTINVVVKNKFSENVLFDERQIFSEDQKYCCEVLKDKLKMGFCSTAKYIYHRSSESSSGKLAGACYIFEQSISFFEELFEAYEHVPMAFQGLFVNDIYWKMQSNIFFPYHYDSEKYERSVQRVKKLLKKCYNSVILDHPAIDFFEKFYLMRLKGMEYIVPSIKKNEIALYSEGYLVLQEKSLEIVITKVEISGKNIRLLGFLKSVFFQFYDKIPQLYAIENEQEEIEISLAPSVHNYYLSHEPTQRFWKIGYSCNVMKVWKAAFYVQIGEAKLPVHYYFLPLIPFSHKYNYYSYVKGDVGITIDSNGAWNFSLHNGSRETERIWIYYDCKGVPFDNGLCQFLYDCRKQDGVIRYYVVSDKRQEKYIPDIGKKVEFGSHAHRQLMMKAEKIVTAYIENNNIFPFEPSEYEKYANRFHFETIYLQHGVLHINMPWKYSPERIIADKIVVSAQFETELFIKNGYAEKDLWKVRMPRFDELPRTSKRLKKIVYAPSWRAYLVGENVNNQWELLTNKYLASNFFKGMEALICSKKLHELLAHYDYQFDIKLHPIFAKYGDLLEINSDNIHLVDEISEEEYCLFITDFSSYMFDFIYMNVPVLSYIPDFDEFRCGMNGYRDVDFLNKVNGTEVAKSSEEIVDKIRNFFETGKGMDYKVDFYLHYENQLSKDIIYKRLMDTN